MMIILSELEGFCMLPTLNGLGPDVNSLGEAIKQCGMCILKVGTTQLEM